MGDVTFHFSAHRREHTHTHTHLCSPKKEKERENTYAGHVSARPINFIEL